MLRTSIDLANKIYNKQRITNIWFYIHEQEFGICSILELMEMLEAFMALTDGTHYRWQAEES